MGMTMADLLAKHEKSTLLLARNQEVKGKVAAVLEAEVVVDLGTKSEGILPKRDLSPEQVANLKVGDEVEGFVVSPENESGQVVLALQRSTGRNPQQAAKWRKFEDLYKRNQTLKARAIELNKGGLVIEASSIRGFLPFSQVALDQISHIDNLVGHDLTVKVIEVDSSQNRLIFAQTHPVSEETKQKLQNLKLGDKLTGKISAILPFGLFIKELPGLEEAEGLVHSSEVSWEKDASLQEYSVGQELEMAVTGVEPEIGRVNLSIRQLTEDPFTEIAKRYQPDDAVKGEVEKIGSGGVTIVLADGLEGIIPASKLSGVDEYKEGDEVTVLVDNIDLTRRRVTFAPFITSTEGLIYK